MNKEFVINILNLIKNKDISDGQKDFLRIFLENGVAYIKNKECLPKLVLSNTYINFLKFNNKKVFSIKNKISIKNEKFINHLIESKQNIEENIDNGIYLENNDDILDFLVNLYPDEGEKYKIVLETDEYGQDIFIKLNSDKYDDFLDKLSQLSIYEEKNIYNHNKLVKSHMLLFKFLRNKFNNNLCIFEVDSFIKFQNIIEDKVNDLINNSSTDTYAFFNELEIQAKNIIDEYFEKNFNNIVIFLLFGLKKRKVKKVLKQISLESHYNYQVDQNNFLSLDDCYSLIKKNTSKNKNKNDKLLLQYAVNYLFYKFRNLLKLNMESFLYSVILTYLVEEYYNKK